MWGKICAPGHTPLKACKQLEAEQRTHLPQLVQLLQRQAAGRLCLLQYAVQRVCKVGQVCRVQG